MHGLNGMKVKLNKEQYILIKKICSDQKIEYVFFDDNERSIRYDDNDIDDLENEFILYVTNYGMDSEQNQYTEYGKELYRLFACILNAKNW